MDQCIARRALSEPEIRSWLAGTPAGGRPARAVPAGAAAKAGT
jgi:hypothetical protein